MRKVKILKPADFFCGIDFRKVAALLHEVTFKTIEALVVYYFIAVCIFVVYYLTFVFRFINEQAESIAEWNLK